MGESHLGTPLKIESVFPMHPIHQDEKTLHCHRLLPLRWSVLISALNDSTFTTDLSVHGEHSAHQAEPGPAVSCWAAEYV